MKKAIALCSALLLAAAFTSCGKSSNDNFSSAPTDSANGSSESSDVEKSEGEEKIVVDPFDKVAYGISTKEEIGSIYPEDFIIQMDASESPFGSHMTFTYFIESADENEIIIKARANVDEIQDFLDEYNYTVEETEKTFSIKTSDLVTNLISPDLISGENKTKIINAMQNQLESEYKMSEDDEYEDPLAALGISSDNPDYKEQTEKEKEEFEKEKAESLETEFTIEKLYAIIPSEALYNLERRKATSGINSRSNEDSFEDEMIYTNTASLQIYDFSVSANSKCFGIFKDNKGNYYCVGVEPIFEKGILIEDRLEFTSLYYEQFPDEDTAYDYGAIKKSGDVNTYFGDDDESTIVEIPLS